MFCKFVKNYMLTGTRASRDIVYRSFNVENDGNHSCLQTGAYFDFVLLKCIAIISKCTLKTTHRNQILISIVR